MSRIVLVVPRSHGAVLAEVVGPAERPGFVRVETADGRRFPFPTERALAQVELPDAAEDLETLTRRLARPVDWRRVHERVGTRVGEPLRVAELVEAESPDDVLRHALDVRRATPWFHRDGARLVPQPRAQVEARLRGAEEERRRQEEDAALVAEWRRGEGAELSEPARAALEALTAFGASADPDTCPRGRRLANGLQLGEPDLVLEALDGRGLLSPDFDPLPARCGLPPFSEATISEVDRVLGGAHDDDGRRDCTSEYAVAIDDATTTEVDDALGFRALDDGWELAVHVADVAASIAPDSPLDALARERASSVYLPERTLPMLPPSLYGPALSLATEDRRRAVTMRFRFDREFELQDVLVERTWVRLAARLVYGQDDDPGRLAATEDEGRALLHLARLLRARRIAAGALVLRLPTLRIHRHDGRTTVSVRTGDTSGDLAVGEAMVLASSHAGRLLSEAGLPAAFRGQEPPRRALPEADDPLFAMRAVRCLSPTRTLPVAHRHHGLGTDAYAQVTSPIRRYGDLVNQRQILAAVGLVSGATYDHSALEELLPHCVERERLLRRAANWREGYWLTREVAEGRHVPTEGRLLRVPRRGRGAVWSPELLRELSLDVPHGVELPPVGSTLPLTVTRTLPWRGRIEVAPASSPS